MALHNLGTLMQACRKRFDALPKSLDLEIPPQFWKMFQEAYERETNDKILHTNQHGFVIGNGNERSDISSRWLLYAYSFSPFYREIMRYRDKQKAILENGLTAGLSADDKAKLKKQLPSPNWAEAVDAILPGIATKIRSRMKEPPHNTQSSVLNFERFLSDRDWWGQGKNFERSDNDWIGSSIRTAARVIHANSDRLPQVIQAVAGNLELRRKLRMLVRTAAAQQAMPWAQIGRNVIYYGAPGTGKSHRIKEEIQTVDETLTVHTVFHADTQTGDFVGSFRPLKVKGMLDYAFQPGPFTIALIRAMKNPADMHYLVIEEINRAPAAAVFGEIFQLLDRKPDGSSSYRISPSDPAHEAYLA